MCLALLIKFIECKLVDGSGYVAFKGILASVPEVVFTYIDGIHVGQLFTLFSQFGSPGKSFMFS